MPERLPIALQRTYDQILWYCDREEKDEFLADDVAAPKGHLRALANRGKVIRIGKVGGRGGGAPIIWKLIAIVPVYQQRSRPEPPRTTRPGIGR